jgi:DNA polymerase III alpha subunit
MKVDHLGNVIYQSTDILELLYQNKIDVLADILVEDSEDITEFESSIGINLKKINQNFDNISKEEFDKICQQDWFMPNEYKVMDIEGFLANVCPKEHYQRLIDELQEFRKRDMLPLLRLLKYLVDTFRQNNIVWGVGRGSSVASYTLFLLGVHKIDSIKYNLDFKEFLR